MPPPNGAFDSACPSPRGPPPVPSFGDRLSPFLQAWREITTDFWVLRIVEVGYRIDFTDVPPVGNIRSTAASEALVIETDTLLAKGAIREVDRSRARDGFFSKYFTVPKADGGLRPILDLKRLNRFIRPKKFRMVTLATIMPLLRRNVWIASIDLKDAYFHISIHRDHHRFLRFAIGDRVFQFQVLPFGLSTAPRVFTKCVAVVCAFLRTLGIEIYPYLDDWLLVASTPKELLSHLTRVLSTLDRLGFYVNEQKSQLVPTQRITFIGAELDSRSTRAFLPRLRADRLSTLARRLSNHPATTAFRIQRLLGHMAATVSVVEWARMRMRPLQNWFIRRFPHDRNAHRYHLTIPAEIVASLHWWTVTDNLLQGLPFAPTPPAHILTTDASEAGWGAHCGHLRTQAPWSATEAKWHINRLELLAVQKALYTFRDYLRDSHVQVLTDNTAVLWHINKQGGTHSSFLVNKTLQILTWCISRGISLSALHIPGVDNTLADSLSRSMVRPHEWEVNASILEDLFDAWGTPTVDLFATAANAKCDRFCSRGGLGTGSMGDAFQIKWTGCLFYAFPPVPLVARVLHKITQDNTDCIVLTPWWPRQPWFAPLLKVSQQTFMTLPRRPNLLTQDSGTLRHPDLSVLRLTAWRISPS